ncbi:flavonoid 3'-monooxygenase-like [Chenopodium quinoa]|uniref:Uncharacterized protein n=1 Tax=Chenopodium quinoa TaxID=63459 RepID=A0A803MCT8_CHEQI|nr:flavonoid 3'-monooxygenase-like [Chenopodium quinoa]
MLLPEATSVWSWWWSSSNKEGETLRNILTILAPLFIIFWFIFAARKQNKENPPLPPGPRGLPLVGYLPFLDSNLHHCFHKLASLYGPIFRFRLGSNECIVVSSPSLVKEVVRDHDVVFANRAPLIAAKSLLFGSMDIAFSDYGVEWRKMRRIFATEMLSNARLDASYYLRKQHVKKMINETYEKAGQLVDIGDLAFLTLVGSVMSMVWGDTLKGNEGSVIDSEFRAVVNEQLELLGAPNISDFFPLLARFDLQGIERKMRIISKRNEEIYDKAIHHYAGASIQRKDFLGHLMQLTKFEDHATSLTLPQVKAMLLDVVVGGTDTTVAMVEWAMAEILRHPEVMRNVQEELTEIVGLNKTVEEVHLPELKYLNAVAKETLRLHPPLPLLVPHCPSEPSTIGGYHIPKGARVFLNLYTIQRDPLIWEDPLLFKAERFLSGSAAEKMDYLGNHFQYLPFGSGRRMCPGIPLAERTSMLVLASMLHAFQWKLPNGAVEVDLSEKFGIVVKKSKPLIAVPSPRISNLGLYSKNDK